MSVIDTLVLQNKTIMLFPANAVVTSLRKAASYEQRKTNFEIKILVPYYHVVPRITQH